MEEELLLTVILQVRAQTGVHLLHHEHRQARTLFQVHPQELDHTGVRLLRPSQALRLKVTNELCLLLLVNCL